MENLEIKRYENIEIFRVIAVLGIFIGHTAQRMDLQGHIRRLTDLHPLCVELFFVISGFLAIMHFDSIKKLRISDIVRYYCKRAVKILPLYYLVILYFYITETYIFHAVPEDPTGLRWSRYIFLLAGNIRSGDSNFGFWDNLASTWTIFVFTTFYLIVPLIALLVKKYWHAVVLVVGSWILRVILEVSDFAYLHTLTYLLFFSVGILVWYSNKEAKHHVTISFIAVAILANLVLKGTILEYNDLIFATLAFALLIISTINMHIKINAVKKIINTLDKYSYTIYLGQVIIFCGIIDKMPSLPKIIIFCISIFGTLLLSCVLYNFYEKPIQRIGMMLINKYLPK